MFRSVQSWTLNGKCHFVQPSHTVLSSVDLGVSHPDAVQLPVAMVTPTTDRSGRREPDWLSTTVPVHANCMWCCVVCISKSEKMKVYIYLYYKTTSICSTYCTYFPISEYYCFSSILLHSMGRCCFPDVPFPLNFISGYCLLFLPPIFFAFQLFFVMVVPLLQKSEPDYSFHSSSLLPVVIYFN